MLFGRDWDKQEDFINGKIDADIEALPDNFKPFFDEICRIGKMFKNKNDKNVSPLGNGTEDMLKILERLGYDGIEYINDWENQNEYTWIAFYPN